MSTHNWSGGAAQQLGTVARSAYLTGMTFPLATNEIKLTEWMSGTYQYVSGGFTNYLARFRFEPTP